MWQCGCACGYACISSSKYACVVCEHIHKLCVFVRIYICVGEGVNLFYTFLKKRKLKSLCVEYVCIYTYICKEEGDFDARI